VIKTYKSLPTANAVGGNPRRVPDHAYEASKIPCAAQTAQGLKKIMFCGIINKKVPRARRYKNVYSARSI
jgi:hypothetical protein